MIQSKSDGNNNFLVTDGKININIDLVKLRGF